MMDVVSFLVVVTTSFATIFFMLRWAGDRAGKSALDKAELDLRVTREALKKDIQDYKNQLRRDTKVV